MMMMRMMYRYTERMGDLRHDHVNANAMNGDEPVKESHGYVNANATNDDEETVTNHDNDDNDGGAGASLFGPNGVWNETVSGMMDGKVNVNDGTRARFVFYPTYFLIARRDDDKQTSDDEVDESEKI